MSVFTAIKDEQLVGRELDSLNYVERLALAGKWVALELYKANNPLKRRIEWIAASQSECALGIRSKGLDPGKYEFLRVTRPD
jgi:hypothetical protein